MTDYVLPNGTKILIGEKYTTRDGEVAIILSFDTNGGMYPVKGKIGRELESWSPCGAYNTMLGDSPKDLINLVGHKQAEATSYRACRHPKSGDSCPLPPECHSPKCVVCPYGPLE